MSQDSPGYGEPAAFRLAAPVDDFLETLFERFWQMAYPRLQALHKSGATLFRMG